jgi:transcription antitermination factor NusG
MLESRFFPGYVFGHFDLAHKTAVVAIPQVVAILGFGLHAVPVPDFEIANVKLMVDSPAPVYSSNSHPLNEGDKVRVKFGPLTGCEGRVLRLPKNKFKLIVSVNLLGRDLCTPINPDCLEYLAPKAVAA